MGNSMPHHHEDHIAGKGENSLQHYNLVHKFIPMPQAMIIPAPKAAVDKEWEKLEKTSAWNLTKVRSKSEVIDEARWPGGWGPQGRRPTGGGELARVPNLRVCKHLYASRWHTQGGKDELTSCRGTVQSAWQKPPVRRKGGRAGLPARVSGRHVVRGRQSSLTLEVRPGEQAMLVKTVNIQVRWAAAQPGQDRRLPSVATHSRLLRATSVRSRVGIVLEDGSGVAIDWVTGRSYSSARRRLSVQSGQRKGGKCAAPPA